ncbi:protein FAR1-RELATED SEQUENCE 5-like [Asparagus officinalis]|uniref:protein FAR1-RELATED SEQUENCE 5-like n=1 Tax=Asparagus officinalis TaxID=4686 RepID=UPI00098E80B1|nr:protein FAR1-RELATED SEQUENCE 5-like [Asparagus officinalis]
MNSGDYNSINLDEVEFVIDETQSDPFQDHSSYVEFEDISTDFGNPEGGFASREDMDAHVRYVAGLRNVTLAIRDSKEKDGRRPKVRYLCSQGGGYRPKKVTGTRSTKTTKNNCPFWLDGMEYPGGRWYFEVREGRHNHPFPSHAVGSRLGKISPIQLEVIREQENFNLSPSNMLASMKRADPENKSCQKQVYNAVNDSIRQLNYMYDVRTADESSELGDIVFCHPASFVMVNAYPEVMMIDCTYNTNEYDIPLLEVVGATSTDKTFTIAYAFMRNERQENYRFVLQFIRTLFVSQVTPNVIVTDRDYALMHAVEYVFPESRHHLCRRHIEQCVLQRALQQPGFLKEAAEGFKFRWNWAISAPTIDDFNDRWGRLAAHYSSWGALLNYCIDTWISPHSQKILSAYIDHYFHFGSYTTNRVEGEHHRVKRHLDGGRYPFDTVLEKLHKVMEGQICEIKKVARVNATKSNTDTLGDTLFVNLNRSITFKAFGLIRKEMQVLQEMGQDPTTCGCYLRRTHGLPCAHELQYYIINGYSIPLDQIHDYWKKLDIQFPIFPNDAADGSPTPPNPVRRALFEEVPDITAPPTAKKKTKGKKLSSLRVPSAWERVVKQYGFKKSPNKKVILHNL